MEYWHPVPVPKLHRKPKTPSPTYIISYPKNISAVKKGKDKLLNDLKMWYHHEAKKKSYTS